MVTRWRLRLRLDRLSGPMSRRPLRFALIATLVGALGATGLFRFSVDAGQSLLVGSTSSQGQTYASFSQTFGSDPIVLVFTARNPTAPYIEHNLQRLGALEIDLSHDPRVASVLGPGTVAGSLRQAAVAEVSKVLTEYPYFVAETDYLNQLRMGVTDQTALRTRLQSDISNAQALLELYVIKAATDAHNARAAYMQASTDRVLDSREKAADAAAAVDPLPPLWAEYLAGPGNPTNQAAAQQFFDRVAAAYGDCDDQIATLLKITPSCQVFFERTLLDLPNCPPVTSHLFCNPKPQWAAMLPAPAPGGDSQEIITVRLKPQYVGNQTEVSALQNKINSMLSGGIADDAYTRTLSSTSLSTLKSLGPLRPTECGGASAQQDPACVNAFHDAGLSDVIAGAPLLGLGVVRSMTQLLIILFPVALLVMLLLLLGAFRVRGRAWPLLAAGAATVLTVGLALLTGTPLTPAVLAGVPVLLGLGVDYAVQVVARFNEERARGADVVTALRLVLGNTGRSTGVAAVATLVGLLALVAVGGIDWGPLVAVPLVAEFALVLCAGVVLAWLGSIFIALPMAVWSDRRRGPVPAAGARREVTPGTSRTLAIADNWIGVVALASVLALAGWILLRAVPVQTDVQQLLAQSLPELGNINAVQAETGYTNEIDVFIRGNVATGPIDTTSGNPLNVEWQCGAASEIRTGHSDQVAQATSIGDYVIASGSSSGSSSSAQCVPPASATPSPSPSPGASPSASPGASPTPSPAPSTSASPTAARTSAAPALQASREVAIEAATTPAPTAATSTTAASPTPSAGAASPSASASAAPVPSPSPGASKITTQTPFLCDLRLFPLLSRSLVMDIGPDTQACPPVDEYQQIFLSADPTPINPTSARIAIGVHSASVADEAKLVDALRNEVSSPPNGMSAAPTGLAVLATTAYDNLVGRAYLLNLAPLLLVAITLLVIHRNPRRALLPVLPTALAAGWAPLLLLLLGRLPGGLGATLGSLNPLTVVLGALVIALGTEFGVVLVGRFYEERARGLDPDAAALAALGGVGRAIRVSALTLGAGFGVLALSGLFPNSLPLVADFGLAVVLDLALAVGAVFLVMLPLAVALERRSPLRVEAVALEPAAAPAGAGAALPGPLPAWREVPAPAGKTPEPADAAHGLADEEPPPRPEPAAGPRRVPGVSGRRRAARTDETPEAEPPAPEAPRRPGVSGRRRSGGGRGRKR